MRVLARLTLAGLLLTAAAPARAGVVKVSFSNGLVTIVATDASPRQILGEWAKSGQVRVTNLERLSGGPITLQLTDVPEAQALETLLRGTAGYVAAPRASVGELAAVSRYDRILLMPGNAPALPVATSSPAPFQPGAGRGRSNMPTFDVGNDDQSDPSRMMPGPNGVSREAQRPGGGTAPMPGQMVMPGQTLAPGQSVSPGQPTMPGMPYQPPSIYSEAATPGQRTVPAPTQQVNPYRVPQPPGVTGTAAPGMPTIPLPIPTSPYSNAGPPTMVQPDDSATWQGPGTTVPGQGPGGASRPGESTAPTPAMFRNPYGLPEPVRPPVVDPYANPYGLPNLVRTPAATPTATPATTPGAATPGSTIPGSTTPPGPIKKNPGEKG